MTPRAAARVSSLFIVALGIALFATSVADPPRFKSDDYGPHDMLTRSLARGIAVGHVPHWLLSVSTGDSPYETYPWLTYAAAALLSLALGGESEAPRALLILAIACHIGLSVSIARLSARFAPVWVATLLGALALVDPGGFESGAARSVIEVGLLHGALAQWFGLAGLVAVVDLVQRGFRKLPVTVAALGFGLAGATHPSGLLFAAAVLAALVCGAAWERTPPRRCLAAALAVAAGVLAAAVVWAPFAERVLRYGAHFGYPPIPYTRALPGLLVGEWPTTSLPWLFAVGWLGVAVAALRRPRGAVVVAALSALFALAFTDLLPWLGFDLAPRLFARLQTFRFLTLLRPLLFVSAGIALASTWRNVSPGLPRWRRFARPAVTLGLTLALGASLLPAPLAALRRLPRTELPDSAGFQQLVDWSRKEARRVPAGKLARLMFRGELNGIYHLTAEIGMPAFYVGDGVAMLLRERIADASPESLRRFDVRYVARLDAELQLGDPASERRFGRYVLREIPSWDGNLARVETGPGQVRVTHLADERIDILLEATDQPALVAFGMGYYPRWRAFTAGGDALPTFALPASPGSGVRVLAAWLPPGRATLRPDAALPSDGAGRVRAVCGVLILGALLAPKPKRWAERRARARLLSRRRVSRGARTLLLLGLVGTLALLCVPRARQALRLFDGLRSEARVEARPEGGGEWVDCRALALRRSFECPGLGRVADTIAFVLSDHPSSTPFVTPGILASADQGRPAEFRVSWEHPLAGPWVGAAWGLGSAWLDPAGEPQRVGAAATRGASPASDAALLLRVRKNSKLGVTVLRADAVDLDRASDVPWAPAAPPAEVARLAKPR